MRCRVCGWADADEYHESAHLRAIYDRWKLEQVIGGGNDMSIIKRATGSNDSPIGDALSRGLIVAAFMGALSFVVVRVDWLTAEDIPFLTPIVTIAAFLAWGAWDRWGRPRLPSA